MRRYWYSVSRLIPYARATSYLLLSCRQPLPQFRTLHGTERSLPSPIYSSLLRQRDPLPLPFPDQRPLELRECSHHTEQRRHRRVLPCEGQSLLDELDTDFPPGERTHNLAQVVEIAGEAVHGMHDDRIPLACEAEEGVELRARDILARGVVGEGAVDGNLFELTRT